MRQLRPVRFRYVSSLGFETPRSVGSGPRGNSTRGAAWIAGSPLSDVRWYGMCQCPRTGRWVRGLLIVLLMVLVVAPPAHGQAFCDEGQTLAPGTAFSALQPLLADVIGEPTECEHAADNGDLLQQTTSGLAFVEAETQAPNFTNGSEHWALVDGDLAYRAEPPAAAPAAPVAM